MSARAVGTVTVSFGLLTIPVKIYLAASSENFSFNMLTPDGNRVKQKLVDSVSGDEIERSACLKALEYEKGKYITFTDGELSLFGVEKNTALELSEFVDNKYFDPIQIEKTYYIAPDKGAERSFLLLTRTMERLGKVAIGKWQTRGRDNLVMIRPDLTGKLVMHQLFFANEIRAYEYQFSAKSEPNEKEIELACRLVNSLASPDFNASNYNDQYAERIRAAIDSKLSGGLGVEQQVAVAPSPVIDLAALLERSLAAVPARPAVMDIPNVTDPPVKGKKSKK